MELEALWFIPENSQMPISFSSSAVVPFLTQKNAINMGADNFNHTFDKL